jgi:hypothetical protein
LALKLPLSQDLPFCSSFISIISASSKLHPKDSVIMTGPYPPQHYRTQYERAEEMFEDGDIDNAIEQAQHNLA